jgi:hypothetical protein
MALSDGSTEASTNRWCPALPSFISAFPKDAPAGHRQQKGAELWDFTMVTTGAKWKRNLRK